MRCPLNVNQQRQNTGWYSLGLLQVILLAAWLGGADLDWWLVFMPLFILVGGFIVSILSVFIVIYTVGEEYEDDSND